MVEGASDSSLRCHRRTIVAARAPIPPAQCTARSATLCPLSRGGRLAPRARPPRHRPRPPRNGATQDRPAGAISAADRRCRRPPPARKNPTSPSAPSSAAISSPRCNTPPTAPPTGNPPSMTLLGELYANGLGVPRDDAKAADWYKLAAARGDRNAMFALGLFAVQGRAGPRDRAQSAKWLAEAAKLGHPASRLRSRAALHRGPTFPAGFQARRRAFAHRRRRRQPAGAICARHLLQGRPRRAERHGRSGQAVGGGGARRRHRRRGRIRHRAL